MKTEEWQKLLHENKLNETKNWVDLEQNLLAYSKAFKKMNSDDLKNMKDYDILKVEKLLDSAYKILVKNNVIK